MTAWLRDRGGLTRREAAHDALRAKRLRQLPVTRQAWFDGSVSAGQVEVVLANIGRHRDRFAAHESSIVPSLVDLSVEDTVQAMQRWRALAALGSPYVVDASERRSQLRNRNAARERLVTALRGALAPPPLPRVPTKPSKRARQRRLDAKKQRGQTKSLRGRVRPD